MMLVIKKGCMKKNGLFLCCENYNFDDVNILCIGIAKKIISQIRALNTDLTNCNLVNLHTTIKNPFIRLIYIFFARKVYIKKMERFDFRLIDFVYIRRFLPLSIGFICMLKHIKTLNQNCKIMYEIPTYPYDGEHKGFKGSIFLSIDKIFRRKLKHYVDYIVTYSRDDTIFDVKTIKIINGIDCGSVHPIETQEYHQSIRLIAVAQFGLWHGYDRLIEGLYEYYKTNPIRKVYLDLIGDGDKKVLKDYLQKILQYKLQEYITYHGLLFGEDLTRVFNTTDIAVCSLANYRCFVFLSSELKSREYMARGLPMLASTKIDVLPDNYPYIQYIPENDSPVNINTVIMFYDRLVQQEDRNTQISNIRRFAEMYFDIHITMQPVIDSILNGSRV